MRYFSRTESARLLGVSVRTLGRWLADGKLTGTKIGEGQFAELRIGLDELQRLGLFIEPEPEQPEPEPEPLSESDNPQPEPFPEPQPQPQPTPEPLDPIEQKRRADLQFAAAYMRGEACDSYGNDIKGPRISDDGAVLTALGPMQPQTRPKPDSTAHMNSALVGTIGVPSADSDAHPLNAGRTVPKPQSPQHPNLQRNKLLHVTLDSWLEAARMGYSR